MTAPILHPVESATGILEVAGVDRSSLVDGPGLRFVLFLQGCNFDCVACHNPSTIGRCTGCGVCVDACPHEALQILGESSIAFDPGACDRCRACVPTCPIDADPTIRLMTMHDVLAELAVVAPFIGGVTVTGGEPTLQLDGLLELFTSMESDPRLVGLTRLVDSNGTLDPDGWDRLVPWFDGAMVDLKAGSDDLHRRLTGQGIGTVHTSIRHLHRRDRLREVRLLVIPGVTDTEPELAEWAAFVRSVDATIPVRVMGFRHAGARPRAHRWPEASTAHVEAVTRRLRSLGLSPSPP